MSINWTRALLAGLVGTLVFDLVGFAFTQQWWDIPGILGGKLELGTAGGVLAHYVNGLILAVIYAGVAPYLWGSNWSRAFTFTTVETILGVWLFMLPILGAGIAGVKLGAMMPVISMFRHWGYGLVLAWLYPVAANTVKNA